MGVNVHEIPWVVSAWRYLDRLDSLRRDGHSEELRQAADAIYQFTWHALRYRTPPAHIPRLTDFLNRLDENELRSLINNFTLYMGNAEARVLIVGTEAAYSLGIEHRSNFALEACALTGLRLCGGNGALVARIAGTTGYTDHFQPFADNPNLYYGITKPGHTWIYTSREVLTRAVPGYNHPGDLFNQSAFLDLSEYPSRNMGGGHPPSQERREFISALPGFLPQVRVVIFHGYGSDETRPIFDRWKPKLASRFLIVDELDQANPQQALFGQRQLLWWTSNGRRVILSPALSGGAFNPRPMCEALGTLLAEMV